MASGAKLHPSLRWNESSARSSTASQHSEKSLRDPLLICRKLWLFVFITGDKLVKVKKSLQSNLTKEMCWKCANTKNTRCHTWKAHECWNEGCFFFIHWNIYWQHHRLQFSVTKAAAAAITVGYYMSLWLVFDHSNLYDCSDVNSVHDYTHQHLALIYFPSECNSI